MGYRSNVTYVVTFACAEPEKAYAQFIDFYEWVTKHHKLETTPSDSAPRIYDYAHHRAWGHGRFYWNVDEMTLVFEAQDIKYYDSYIETQWDEKLLKKVEDYSCGVYKFVRVGEDPSDIEYKDYSGDDIPINFCLDLYTEVRIVCDLPDEKDFEKEPS